MRHKLGLFLRLPLHLKALAVEAGCYLLFGWLAVKVFPNRWVVSYYGVAGVESPKELAQDQLFKAIQIGRALNCITKTFPGLSNCLVMATASKLMLKRRGIACTLFIGFKHGGARPINPKATSLMGHAWLRCGSIVITGNSSTLDSYQVVSCFGGI